MGIKRLEIHLEHTYLLDTTDSIPAEFNVSFADAMSVIVQMKIHFNVIALSPNLFYPITRTSKLVSRCWSTVSSDIYAAKIYRNKPMEF